MATRLRLAPTLLAAAVLAAVGVTHVRLRHPSNGNELFWQTPSAISIVISSAGSDDLSPGEHEPALRLAIDAWNRASGSGAQLVENTAPSARTRTDWPSDSVHLVLFDESNSSGYFPPGSGTVAITPVQYYSSGRIADADILFNGAGYSFTTSGAPGAFDVQDVAAHELGHLLGLDHTGVAGATLYPYVDPSVIEHRSLAQDDVGGARHAAPAQVHASVSGTVRRSADSSPVAGAHVVARDSGGRTAGATLTASDGSFTLRGLDGGSYALYAAPLDAPVSAANLSGGRTIQTDFQPIVGSSIAVAPGASASYGTLWVGPDAQLSLGRNYDDFPLRATRGATTLHVLHGAGMGNGCTLQASDPMVSVSTLGWSGTTQVMFSVTVLPNAEPGHVDLELSNGDLSILAGALEITPADPSVASVTPAQGTVDGGTSILIDGSGFRAGASVVIGGELYTDGEPGGCTVVDANTIALVTHAVALAETCDVVVIDPSGVEGRASAGFTYTAGPQIEVVFPSAGADVGGTEVAISGTRLVAPVTVRIDGVVQADVTVVSDELVRIVTEPGFAGGPAVLELEDGQGRTASALFQYTTQPDPVLAVVSPSEGTTAGGTEVTLSGANFAPGAIVVFGADPATGLGGTPASGVTWLDASTLVATTPASASGVSSVAVLDAGSGQATVAAAAFTFRGSSGGGGGGCAGVVGAPPMDGSARLSAAGWIPALLALLLLGRARRRGLAVR